MNAVLTVLLGPTFVLSVLFLSHYERSFDERSMRWPWLWGGAICTGLFVGTLVYLLGAR